MTGCVNLLETFSGSYKVTFDEAYSPRHVPRDKLDPWMMTLPCERGIIYPFGGDRLAVAVDDRTITAKAVAAIPGVTVHQDGDTEKTYTFPVSVFEQVAAVVKPRKRRHCHLTDDQKQEAGERLKAYRFSRVVTQS